MYLYCIIMYMLGRNNVLQTVYIWGQVTGHASLSTLDITVVESVSFIRHQNIYCARAQRVRNWYFYGNYG